MRAGAGGGRLRGGGGLFVARQGAPPDTVARLTLITMEDVDPNAAGVPSPIVVVRGATAQQVHVSSWRALARTSKLQADGVDFRLKRYRERTAAPIDP